MLATLDKPAVMTATLSGPTLTETPGPPRVLLTIVAFTPPPDKKPVEIVVSAARHDGSARHELGRVAISPYAAFGRGDTKRWQNFAFALPDALTGQATLTLSVALVPALGGGKGASLEVGSAAIH